CAKKPPPSCWPPWNSAWRPTSRSPAPSSSHRSSTRWRAASERRWRCRASLARQFALGLAVMSTRRGVRSATLPFTQSIAGCLASSIGEHGLSDAELASWLSKLAAPMAELQESYRQRTLPLLRLAEETADLEAAETAYAKLVTGARALVFFGI